MMRITALFSLLLLVACATTTTPYAPDEASLSLQPAAYTELPGWQTDDMTSALLAFNRSCGRILKRSPSDSFGPVGGTYGDWQPVCRDLASRTEALSAEDARQYIRQWFTPWQAIAGERWAQGLFTGYYEASLQGSRTKSDRYHVPLFRRPSDLVMVELGEFRDSLKGQRIAGRVVGGALKPYETRAQIDQGKLPDEEALALVWVDDPVDAFFLHIQGSGRVQLDDGTSMHVGYAAQNGHTYFAIGRELIKRGALDKENVSMQTIRDWLERNPDQADELMHLNPSYIFFQELSGDGPLGAEGLPLTPGRSIAIDRTKIPYGTPLWVDITHPQAGQPNLQRLMVAQDTGGAIKGAIRGDFFWGYGDQEEALAGVMKSPGRYWLLLPKSVQP